MTILIRCLDVETTGLDPAVHRVVEIATVDVTVEPIPDQHPLVTRGEMWSSLVNPGHEIPPQASAVHDITDEMVTTAPKIFDLFPIVQKGPPDYYCAYNSRFDQQFVPLLIAKPWLDTYRIALWLWPSAPEHKLATLRYWLKLKLGLFDEGEGDSMIRRRNNRSHTALWDAYVCAAVLRRAFTAGATIEQMVEVSSQPALLPRLTFGEHAMKPIEDIPRSYLDWILSPRGIKDNEDVAHTAFAELQRRRNLDKLENRPA